MYFLCCVHLNSKLRISVLKNSDLQQHSVHVLNLGEMDAKKRKVSFSTIANPVYSHICLSSKQTLLCIDSNCMVN